MSAILEIGGVRAARDALAAAVKRREEIMTATSRKLVENTPLGSTTLHDILDADLQVNNALRKVAEQQAEEKARGR